MRHLGGGLQQAIGVEDRGLKSWILLVLKRALGRLNRTRPGSRAGAGPEGKIATFCDRTISNLLEAAWADLFGRTVVLNLDGPATGETPQAFGLSRPGLPATPGGSLRDDFAERFRTGAFERPSPFGTGGRHRPADREPDYRLPVRRP